MGTPCCYCRLRDKKRLWTRAQGSEKVDDALEELGILSSVTQNEGKTENELPASQSAGSSLGILQMNSNYVTNFAFSKSASVPLPADSCSIVVDYGKGTVAKPEALPLGKHQPTKRERRERRRRLDPYGIPIKRKKQVEKGKAFYPSPPDTKEVALVSSSVPRQDSGNKSNPGSPVKGQKIATNGGCSISRSRSLDNLEIDNLDLADSCGIEAGQSEIDTVSQRINNLHVA